MYKYLFDKNKNQFYPLVDDKSIVNINTINDIQIEELFNPTVEDIIVKENYQFLLDSGNMQIEVECVPARSRRNMGLVAESSSPDVCDVAYIDDSIIYLNPRSRGKATIKITEVSSDISTDVQVLIQAVPRLSYHADGGGVVTASTITESLEKSVWYVQAESYDDVLYRFVQWSDGSTENPREITIYEDTELTAFFEPILYNVEARSSNEELGTVLGGGQFMYGSYTTLSAIPNSGYQFDHWSDGSTENPRGIMIYEDVELTAFFETSLYTIEVRSSNEEYGTVSGGGQFMPGSYITISAIPNDGGRFIQWSDGDTNPERTIKVYKDAVYEAIFEELNLNQVIYYTSKNGSVIEPRYFDFGASLVENTYINGQGMMMFNRNVTRIGNSAFYYLSSLTSITIPDSVTSIGESAFDGCSSLTSVTLPNSITSIGSFAFSGTPWLDNLPQGEHYAGKVFLKYKSVSGVTSVVIKEGTIAICAHAFSHCSSLTSVTIPNSVTSIGEGAFYNCSDLISVTIPNSVTSIEDIAFYGCYSLTSVTIPNSVTNIGDGAFDGCVLSKDKFINNSACTSDNNWGATLADKEQDGLLIKDNVVVGAKRDITTATIPNGIVGIGDYAFQDCSSLTSITIPSSVTSIGNYAFYYCSSLTSVTIPNSVTSIGYYAFRYCSSLTSITIPNSVTSIGNYTFSDCSSLTSITIPNSVTSIGWNALYNCSSLNTIYVEATTPPVLEPNNKISNITAVYVPEGSVEAYKTATNWSYYADKIQSSYTPQTCSQLLITADDVIGNQITTTIHWEALTSGVDFKGNTLENVCLSGTATSDKFEQNLSTTDTVQRTITYTYLGVTAETTITQGTWVNQQYTLDLNNQWRLSTDQANPDISLYDGVYQSFSNYNTNSSTATAYLTLIGYTDFELYIRSNAESSFDYTTVSEVNSNTEKASTKSKQSSDQSINGYQKVSYTNLDPDVEYTITITYKKDRSGHSGTDRGYLLIPRHQ